MKTIAIAFMFMIAGTASARGLDYKHIADYTSEAGETLPAFLHRVGPEMRAYSDDTGFEVCAGIASDGERFGLVVGTNKSHIGCAIVHSNVPAGMTYTGETVHTHGIDRSVNMNRNDKIFTGMESRSGVIPVAGQVLDAFSPTDFQRAGYLIAPGGRVFYQQGKGTTQEIAR